MGTKKIAITGGIGSGKSTVLQYLKEKGYFVFSCDEIYKDLSDTVEFIEKLKELFPVAIVDGKLERKKLSNIVFNDKEKLLKLNKLTHPLIMKKLLDEMEKTSSGIVFAEVPLLFEENYQTKFDCVIVVRRELNDRIEAIKSRDRGSEEEILQRIHAQFDYDNKLKAFENKNIYILENKNSIPTLKMNMDKILLEIDK